MALKSENKALAALRLSIPARAIQGGPHKYYKNPPKAVRPIIWATGGLGDALLSMHIAELIEDKVQQSVIFYTRYPEVVGEFCNLDVRDEKQFIPVGADWWITLNTLALFNFQNNFKGFSSTKVEEMFLAYRAFLSQGDWKFIVNRQPLMENITGVEAVKMGLNRRTLIPKILGLPEVEFKKKHPSTDLILDGPFITIHDGYDDANDKVKARSTKNWDLDKWNKLILVLKLRFPDVKIIQLGGKTARVIDKVDYSLVNSLSIMDSLAVLSKSLLHIDNESGLVHAAHMLGVRSVVLFGPTNLDFFGYPDNLNIAPHFCADAGGCWWLKQDWMSKCALGYVSPLCMDSIELGEVFQKIVEGLNGRV